MLYKLLKKSYSKTIRHIVQIRGRLLGLKARNDIMNHLIKKKGFKTYLEIGIEDGICLKKINCNNKTGVDPNPLIHYIENTTINKMTSDEFFKNCNTKFDLIFIDGLHTHEQSYTDFLNACKFLKENGIIVLHDCNPVSEEHAKSFNEGGKWNGDVFKTITKINSKGEYTVNTVNIDHGCGIIELKASGYKFDYLPDYKWFDKNRNKALNLISWDEFINKY